MPPRVLGSKAEEALFDPQRLGGQTGRIGAGPRVDPATGLPVADPAPIDPQNPIRGQARPDEPGDIGGIVDAELYEYLQGLTGLNTRVDFGEAYDPSEYIDMAGSAVAGDAVADPRALEAAYDGLDELQQMADQGFLPDELAAIEQMGQRQDTSMRGGEMANFEQMEAMGIGGAGMEQVQALNAAQAGAQQSAMRDLQTQAAAEERKRFATFAAGKLGADLAQDSFNRDFMTGEAQDIAAEKQAEMMQSWEENRAAEVEQERVARIALEKEKFALKADGVGMIQTDFAGERGSNQSIAEAEVSGEASAPHQTSGWSQGLAAGGAVASGAWDLYAANEKKKKDDLAEAEKATREAGTQP